VLLKGSAGTPYRRDDAKRRHADVSGTRLAIIPAVWLAAEGVRILAFAESISTGALSLLSPQNRETCVVILSSGRDYGGRNRSPGYPKIVWITELRLPIKWADKFKHFA
jgi:hypothetical protein